MNPTEWGPNNPFPHNISSSTSPPDPVCITTEQSSHPEQKGKGRSAPLEIPSSVAENVQHDLFSMSLDSSSSPELSHPGPASPPVIRNDLTFTSKRLTPHRPHHDPDCIPYDTDLPYLDKGKGRDAPPILPPLTFPPIMFDICPSPSLISEPGPSSYGSLHPQHIEHESPSYTPPVFRNSTTHGAAPLLDPALPRRRSFSNPSPRHPERLVSPSMRTGVNIESSRVPFDRLHKHSSSGRRQTRSVPGSPGVGVQVPFDLDAVDAGSCLAAWKRDFKSQSKGKPKAGSSPYLVLDRFDEGSPTALQHHYPVYFATRPAPEERTRKAMNGRSYSDPFPLPHPFDVVSPTNTDVFMPIPILNPPNLFDGMLPPELRLRIFGFLVEIYEEDHARRVCEGRWTANKASRHKWVGRDQGVRELMRLKRVSTRSIPLIFTAKRVLRVGL